MARSRIAAAAAMLGALLFALVLLGHGRGVAVVWAPAEALAGTSPERAAELALSGRRLDEFRAWARFRTLDPAARRMAARRLGLGALSDDPAVRDSAERALGGPLRGERAYAILGLASRLAAPIDSGSRGRGFAYLELATERDAALIDAELRQPERAGEWLEALALCDAGRALIWQLARGGDAPGADAARRFTAARRLPTPEQTAILRRVEPMCTYAMGLEACLAAYERTRDAEVLAPVAILVCSLCRNEGRYCDELRALRRGGKIAEACDAVEGADACTDGSAPEACIDVAAAARQGRRWREAAQLLAHACHGAVDTAVATRACYALLATGKAAAGAELPEVARVVEECEERSVAGACAALQSFHSLEGDAAAAEHFGARLRALLRQR